MKNIKTTLLTILGVALVTVGLYACSNDSEASVNNSNENANLVAKTQISHFDKVLSDKSVIVGEFSEYIANIGIQKMELQAVSSTGATLKVTGFKNTFVNLHEYDFAKKTYHISLVSKDYLIKSEDNDIDILYSTGEKKFSAIYKGTPIAWDKIDNNIAPYTGEYADILIKSALLAENIDIITKPTLPMQPSKWEGIGVGIHIDRKTAEKECHRDHQRILAANKGWCSTGVSLSCGFGLLENHACVCSTTFYSGEDCK